MDRGVGGKQESGLSQKPQLLPPWGGEAQVPVQPFPQGVSHGPAGTCWVLSCTLLQCSALSVFMDEEMELREVCDLPVVPQLVGDRAGTSTRGLLTPGPVSAHSATADSGPRL